MTAVGNGCVGSGMGVREAARKAARLAMPNGPGAVLFAAGKMEAARLFYEAMLRADPESREAHAGLYYAFSALGDSNRAVSHLGRAMQWPSIIKLPFHGQGEPVPVLLLLSLNAGNVLIQRFLNDRIFQTYVMFVESHDETIPLPDHRLVVNGIGDADVRGEALIAAEGVLARSAVPVINRPDRVLATGRCENALRLGRIPGVVTPRTAPFRREQLMHADAGPATACAGLRVSLARSRPRFPHGKKLCSRGSHRRS